jgi:hypothetical protein
MKGGAQEDFLTGLDYYERAVALDPAFAAGPTAVTGRTGLTAT